MANYVFVLYDNNYDAFLWSSSYSLFCIIIKLIFYLNQKKGRTVKNNKTKKSLKVEALKIMFLSVIFLHAVTITICFRFYLHANMSNHKKHYENIAAFCNAELNNDYVEKIFQKTKDIYATIPEEIRKDPFTEEYKEYFSFLLDDDFFAARKVLTNCRETNDITNICLAFFDQEYERLVLVIDGDISGYAYMPGQYISNDNGTIDSWDEIQKIITSTSHMSLSHSSLIGYAATDYVPLYAQDGTLIGLTVIDTSIIEFSDELTLFMKIFVPALLAIFLILSLLLSRIMDRRVMSPIRLLANAAKSYTKRDKVNIEENTNYFKNIKLPASDELSELGSTMADMEENINLSIQEIRHISAERERISAELNIASQIQQSALPTDFNVDDKVDLFASMTPAKEVAGDFYDFFKIDDDHLAMIIADVSGKGIPAALFMMKGKELIRMRAEKGGRPSEILEYVNNALSKGNDNAMFITIWLGILEISTGILTASNAGHEYPFIADKNGVFRIYEDPHGAFCGAFEGLTFEDYEITIPKGGGLFLYTDGVAEAKRANDEMFETSRIEKSLNAHPNSTSKELLTAINSSILEFTEGEEQYDDITMMCLIMH